MSDLADVSSAVSVHPPHRLGVILVAAGAGQRLGAGIPKALVPLRGRTLLERSIQTIVSLEMPGHLVVVLPEGHAAAGLNALEAATANTRALWGTSVAPGGSERQDSVHNGLAALPQEVDVVLVHDVARPLTPAQLFLDVAHAVREQNTGVVPVLPVTDTVKRIDSSGTVLGTVDRSELALAQTPQGFPREMLQAAYDDAKEQFTDDAAVVQFAGFSVVTIAGHPLAHKLTSPADARLLEWMLDTEEVTR